jgi:hypothetical protein
VLAQDFELLEEMEALNHEDVPEVDAMLRMAVFPMNPEIAWEEAQVFQPAPCPSHLNASTQQHTTPPPNTSPIHSDADWAIHLPNPFADLLMNEDDDWASLSSTFEPATLPEPTPMRGMHPLMPQVCRSTDRAFLYQVIYEPVTELLGARPLKHLPAWAATCGGEDFMRLGMQTYWKDPVDSPRRLRMKALGRQRTFSREEEVEFNKLLKEEIDQGIVIVVPDSFPAYVSPVHIVPKKDGWRKVWDGREVNAEQVDIHFRMEGPETVQRLMRRGDWMTSIDLKSAFNHLTVHPSMRPFLCFRYSGKSYS